MPTQKTELSVLSYDADGEDIEVVLIDDDAWMTQKSMSMLFETDQSRIATHLSNIYTSKELEETSTTQKIQSASSAKPVKFYSLDAIISIGYRIDSRKATRFRIWATNILRQYIKDGYVINDELLRSDPQKLNKLAAKIRELRANEKNIYASVRECFKLASSDYEPSSDDVKKFYSLLQDKFHHAITQMTASKLILDRASHTEEKMGLSTVKGVMPTLAEAKTGKNYLSETEIYRMHLLSEQFLLYAESTALAGKNMTMKILHNQLDNLLQLNGYPVFDGYVDYLKDKAMRHAEREHEIYIEILKLQHIGVNVDLDLYYQGEYSEYKEETSKITIKQLSKSLTVQ